MDGEKDRQIYFYLHTDTTTLIKSFLFSFEIQQREKLSFQTAEFSVADSPPWRKSADRSYDSRQGRNCGLLAGNKTAKRV